MDLQIIRKLCENRTGGIKKLSSDIGMSEANLHRCINNNKMQASDIEKIASLLNIKVGVFFGEPSANNDAPSINQSNNGNSNVLVGHDNNGHIAIDECKGKLENAQREIEHLREVIDGKNQIIEEKERLINVLMNK